MGIKPLNFSVTVATAGTRVQITSTSTYATSVYFESDFGNSGLAFAGTSNVSSTSFVSALSPGQGIGISIDNNSIRPSDANGGPEINLNTLFVDAQTSGAVIHVSYLQRVGPY